MNRQSKQRIFEIIEKAETHDTASKIYDIFMIISIAISLSMLFLKGNHTIIYVIEYICIFIFLSDYGLRWYTSDIKIGKGKRSFFQYPFTLWAVIDALAILSSFNILSYHFKTLKIFKGLILLRIFRVIKFIRHLAGENIK